MNNDLFIKYFLIYILFTLFACSSSNEHLRETLPEIQNGNKLLESAEYLVRINDLNSALETYFRAFNQFTLVDHLEGKFVSVLGIIKTYILAANYDNAKVWMNKIETFEESTDKISKQYALTKVEYHFSKKEYEIVKQLTEINHFPNQIRLPMAAYRVQALSILKLNYSQDIKILIDAVKRFQENAQDFYELDSTDMEFIYFTLGYIRTKEKDWESAEMMFSRALVISKENSHYKSIADNLFFLAIVNRELQRFESAMDFFHRSADIYIVLKDASAVERAQAEILNLKIQLDKK